MSFLIIVVTGDLVQVSMDPIGNAGKVGSIDTGSGF